MKLGEELLFEKHIRSLATSVFLIFKLLSKAFKAFDIQDVFLYTVFEYIYREL